MFFCVIALVAIAVMAEAISFDKDMVATFHLIYLHVFISISDDMDYFTFDTFCVCNFFIWSCVILLQHAAILEMLSKI